MSNARVKINLNTGEIELEGSETFVENQLSNLDSIVELLMGARGLEIDTDPVDPSNFPSENGVVSTNNPVAPQELEVPDNFGEWMHKFKEGIDGPDQALLTAFFVQKQSTQNDFKTIEVNKSLIEHGIKLANPSDTLNRLVTKKYLFQTRKAGKLKFFEFLKTDYNN